MVETIDTISGLLKARLNELGVSVEKIEGKKELTQVYKEALSQLNQITTSLEKCSLKNLIDRVYLQSQKTTDTNRELIFFLAHQRFLTPTHSEYTVLHAIIERDEKKELESHWVEKFVLFLNIFPELINCKNFGYPPLHWAYIKQLLLTENDVVQLFKQREIMKSFDPNLEDFMGNTLLHYAVMHSHFLVLKELRGLGADPNLKNHCNRTPKELAESKSQEIKDLFSDWTYLKMSEIYAPKRRDFKTGFVSILLFIGMGLIVIAKISFRPARGPSFSPRKIF